MCQALERHPRGVTLARRAQPERWGGGEGAAESTVVRLLDQPWEQNAQGRLRGSTGELCKCLSPVTRLYSENLFKSVFGAGFELQTEL